MLPYTFNIFLFFFWKSSLRRIIYNSAPTFSFTVSPFLFYTSTSFYALSYSPLHPTLRVWESELSVHKDCCAELNCGTDENKSLPKGSLQLHSPPNTVYHFKPSYSCELLSCLTVVTVILFITINSQHTFSTAKGCLEDVRVSTSLMINTPDIQSLFYENLSNIASDDHHIG